MTQKELKFPSTLAASVVLAGLTAMPAQASLLPFASFSGNVAMSTDGWGGTDGSGVIRASAPSGSTVKAAYLYTSTFSQSTVPSQVTFDGNAIASGDYTALGVSGFLQAFRTDVTSIVAPTIDGGAGGVYNFSINEGGQSGSLDGHALVVVYENATLPDASVGILDGFSAQSGDSTAINFADPLNVSDPGFFAEMILGIGFSCCQNAPNSGQVSIVDVNGSSLTRNAGSNDDGENNANGSLITVGSFDDPFSPTNPGYLEDTERYDLAGSGFLNDGDLTISVDTRNPSFDDNIFLAAFYVSGRAGFNEPPPPPPGNVIPLPAGVWLMLSGLGALGLARRRTKL